MLADDNDPHSQEAPEPADISWVRDAEAHRGLDGQGLEARQGTAAGSGAGAKRERSGFVEALVLVLVALVLALTLKTYVAEAYEIKGRSMRPNFDDGQRVVVLKSYTEIVRGDIIVFASPEEAGKDLIKRVVGLPGERLEIRNGHIFVNGAEIEEKYNLTHDERDRRERTQAVEIPAGCYYVLGDNRPDSHDSRYFKWIPAESIKGKVVARWWPFSEISSF